jgi:hypothetical protein
MLSARGVCDRNGEPLCQILVGTGNLHFANLPFKAEHDRFQSAGEITRPALLPCPTAAALDVIAGHFILKDYSHHALLLFKLCLAFEFPHCRIKLGLLCGLPGRRSSRLDS